jgi:hypothetical protein
MHALLAKMLGELGDSTAASAHHKLAKQHLAVHTAAQQQLLEQIRLNLPARPAAFNAPVEGRPPDAA